MNSDHLPLVQSSEPVLSSSGSGSSSVGLLSAESSLAAGYLLFDTTDLNLGGFLALAAGEDLAGEGLPSMEACLATVGEIAPGIAAPGTPMEGEHSGNQIQIGMASVAAAAEHEVGLVPKFRSAPVVTCALVTPQILTFVLASPSIPFRHRHNHWVFLFGIAALQNSLTNEKGIWWFGGAAARRKPSLGGSGGMLL